MKAHRSVLLLTLCLVASDGWAQDPKGSELRINRRTAGTQRLPDVATAADGSFVVVWKQGDENQDLAKPIFVMARLFDAAGRPRSGEIRVASLKPHSFDLPAAGPAVAMAPDGRFVVVWGGGMEDPYLGFGRRFAADGRPLGPRFRLAGSAQQREPDVAMAPDGSFVAVWYRLVEPTDKHEVPMDVFFRRFGPDGRPLGPETEAMGGYEEQSSPRVAMRPDGGFVVVCHEWGEGQSYDVLARLFSRDGTPAGDEFTVNDSPNPYVEQVGPEVAVAADGRFAVVWSDRAADSVRDPNIHDNGNGDSYGVAVRFFAADGTALGPGRFVNAFLRGVQGDAVVTALQNGGFLVLWTSGAGQDGDGYGIFARVYGRDGKPRGREFRINLNRNGSQVAPAVAIAPNGKGAAAWAGPDGDGTGIFARLVGIPRQGS